MCKFLSVVTMPVVGPHGLFAVLTCGDVGCSCAM